MRRIGLPVFSLLLISTLCACSTMQANQLSYNERHHMRHNNDDPPKPANYESRLPQHIRTGERTVVVDPNKHVWGAYDSSGNLVRAGLATAGSHWCPDIHRPCRTKAGSFRIHSMGSPRCKSSIYPLPRGGAPMPYCMFFNRNQGLHGSYEVVEGNVSHGCVRMRVNDAKWLRYEFAQPGTKVIVRPY